METNQLINADALQNVNISGTSFLISLILTLLASIVLRSIYIKYGRSMNNRAYFANTFILLGLTTCSVIMVVKYSLALSLGLVGALSIVRFRAAIKEPEELVYLFLIISMGLSFGANQYLVGIILLLFSLIVIIISSRIFINKNNLDHSGLLVILFGQKKIISNLQKKELKNILENSGWAFVKEVEYEGNSGKIILNISSNDNGQKLVTKLEELSIKNNLDFNLISDVNVPL